MPKRYKNIDILKSDTGRRYYKNVIYPEIPEHEDDLYVITTGGDRYDILAQQFYKDSSLWWVIASANAGVSSMDSLAVQLGVQLRIPYSAELAIQLFEDLNQNR